MLPRVPGDERADFIITTVATMMEHGTAGMSGEEFKKFKNQLQDILDNAKPGEAVEGNSPSPVAADG